MTDATHEAIARRRVHHLIRTKQLASLREAVGLSQGDISRALDLSQSTVSRWESGDTKPTGRHAVELLELLDGQL
jgi:DNA-binding transcriptional regulator YiaG